MLVVVVELLPWMDVAGSRSAAEVADRVLIDFDVVSIELVEKAAADAKVDRSIVLCKVVCD